MQVLNNLGMDLTTAINIYLIQIIEKNGIPFEVVSENGLSPAQELSILKDLKSARKSKKKYSSAKSMHKAILGK